MMKGFLFILFAWLAEAGAHCLDINGRTIVENGHFVPGPDACTFCICEKGQPSLCKAVLCKPPECQSFIRVGPYCCNFTCLDDALHKQDELRGDMGLRLAVSAVAALLSLSLLFFLVHRLRQRKAIGRQARSLRAERRGLGYLTGSLGYLPENYYPGADGFDRHIEFHYEEAPSHMSLWKPPGGGPYLPRGEAPPPYDEVVGCSRPELIITASSTLPNISHRTIPLNLTAPGMIRIMHPQRRAEPAGSGAVTLPRTPTNPSAGTIASSAKPLDVVGSTLHINITGCGFHAVQSADGAAQVPTPLELAEKVISADALYENAHAFNSAAPIMKSESIQVLEETAVAKEEIRGEVASVGEIDHDEHDDYRSECENCKSSPSGERKLYAEEEPDPPETMTLHRLPRETDEDDAYYRSSVTLPAHCKKPRRVLGCRDGWFSAMPESSSEEE